MGVGEALTTASPRPELQPSLLWTLSLSVFWVPTLCWMDPLQILLRLSSAFSILGL